MSKLSKFKRLISVTEAADLLSRLIDQKVSVDDIRDLVLEGCLHANIPCSAELFRVDFSYNSDDAEMPNLTLSTSLGEKFGECSYIDAPLFNLAIGNEGFSYILVDEALNFYALRNTETGELISDDRATGPQLDDARFYPKEIYDLAANANNDSWSEPVEHKPLENLGGNYPNRLYNMPLTPSDKFLLPSTLPMHKPESPSSILALGAIIEVVTSTESKNRNQSSLIEEILDGYELRGLSKSNLEKMFSQANRKLIEAKAAKD